MELKILCLKFIKIECSNTEELNYIVDDLTIILTLKGRRQFTKRWLDWMAIQNCPYKILIADGSGESDKKFLQKDLENQKYSSLDIDYYSYPYDENIKNYIRKYSSISGKVNSKYAFVADNDDLLIISNITSALLYLNNNPMVETLALPHYRFNIEKTTADKNTSGSVYAYQDLISFEKLIHITNPRLLSEDVYIRLKETIKLFPSDYIYYGIHKAENFKKINGLLQGFVTENFIFQEYFITYASVISGLVASPSELLPIVVRQENTSQLAVSLIDSERLSTLVSSASWGTQLDGMKLALEQVFNNSYPDNSSNFSNIFDDSFEDMVSATIRRAKIGFFLKWSPGLTSFAVKVSLFLRGKNRIKVSDNMVQEDSKLSEIRLFLSR